MKKIGDFIKSYNLVYSKNLFMLYINKSVKALSNVIFPKCLLVLGKWCAGRGQFHIWTNITNHFYKSLTLKRPLFEIRQISQSIISHEKC